MEEWIKLATPFASGIFALLGTLAGGAITFLTQRHLAKRALRQTIAETASAFAAEIEAYLSIVAGRGHIEVAEQMALQLEFGVNHAFDGFGVDKDEELDAPFPIFRSLHGRIGLLGHLSKDLAIFYMQATAVRMSARSAARGEYEGLTPHQKAAHLREELALWKRTAEVGLEIIPKLRQFR